MNTKGAPAKEEPFATRTFWLGAILLILATLAAYWPVFSAGFIWDDDDYVLQNKYLHDLDGLWQIWLNPTATPQYYPLVHTTFWLEYHLWGLNPLGFHVVNVLLHVVSALLLWRILARLKLPGAWLAAAVFALHPVQVESVAWVTERKNVLSAVFYFLAALAYLKFSGISNRVAGEKARWEFYVIALFCFVAALLCKTVTCSLPAALVLILWWKKENLQWRDLRPLVPFFMVGLGLGLTTAWLEKHHVGAHGADWALTFVDRCLIAGRALCFYMGKLIWPAPLIFIYPRWTINPTLWWQWLFPAAVIAVIIGLWWGRDRIGRGPLVAILYFAGTLLPALGFVDVYPMRFSFVADHFQYLASTGMIVLIVSGAAAFCSKYAIGHQVQMALAGVVLLILAALTWQQTRIYRNLETLWADTLQKNPRCWMAHTNLGRLLAQSGNFAEAEAHYQAALTVKPDEDNIHYNYGNLLARTGRLDEAINQYRIALEIAPEKPEAHNNLGFVLTKLHHNADAITEFEQAIALKPDYTEAYYNLGAALTMEHRTAEAIAAYQHGLQLNPDSELFKKRLQALGVPAN